MTSTPEATDGFADRSGQTIADRYRLVRWIGAGGMGEVYEAEHVLLGRKVALKLLQTRHLNKPELLRRFRREARAASLFHCEHVIAVTDFGFADGGVPFMVMELPEGEDLRHLLSREGHLAPVRAVNLLIDVCRGLDVVHSNGIIHRDLKPSNLYVASAPARELCKIIDFGIAKLSAGSGLSMATEEGAALGTLNYMAPEQARGEVSIDRRADIYSLAAILYECLCGTPPFEAKQAHALLYKINHAAPVTIDDVNPDLPPGLGAVVMRGLAKAKEDRFASAIDFAAALAPYGGKHVPPLARHADVTPRAAPAASDPSTDTLTFTTPGLPRSRWSALQKSAPLLVAGIALGASGATLLERVLTRASEGAAQAAEMGSAEMQPITEAQVSERAPEVPSGVPSIGTSVPTLIGADWVPPVEDDEPGADLAPATPPERAESKKSSPTPRSSQVALPQSPAAPSQEIEPKVVFDTMDPYE